MKTQVLTPLEIFNMPQRLLVPLFQRPYVWSQEMQWEPLWKDIERVADRVMTGRSYQTQPHFLGAVVLQQVANPVGNFQERIIIDGQQRLTTLQIIFDAIHRVLESKGADQPAKRLRGLFLNAPEFCANEEDRFKVWPTNRDRAAFVEVLSQEGMIDYELNSHHSERLQLAHKYFTEQITNWLDLAGTDSLVDRAEALEKAVRDMLQLVAIDLTSEENAQEIFETLNSRGSPLTAADLIKNFVFQHLLDEGANTEQAYHDFWEHFERGFWEKEASAGRYRLPRVSLFLNNFLVSRLGETVAAQEVFSRFKTYALLDYQGSMLDLVKEIKRASLVYENFVKEGQTKEGPISDVGLFSYRTEVLDSDIAKALVLVLLDPERPPIEQSVVERCLRTTESFLVRRMLVRGTTKNYNRLFPQLIAELLKGGRENADSFIEQFFAEQTADANYWPDDSQIRRELPGLKVYGRISGPRRRMLLEAIEDHQRGFGVAGKKPMAEQRCARWTLSVEHVIPQSWEMNWPLEDGETEYSRDLLVNRIGNLTLLTQKLNSKISNGPWVGQDGKRESLKSQSTLLLNKELCDLAIEGFGTEQFNQRNRELVEAVIKIWSVPEGHQVIIQGDEGGIEVSVSDLISSGLVNPGATLVPNKEKFAGRSATVLADGRIEADDGTLHTSLSGVGKYVTGRISIAGWNFWLLDESGLSMSDVRNTYRNQHGVQDGDNELEEDD